MRDEVTARLGADAPVWWLPGRVRDRNAVPVARGIASAVRRFAPDVVHAQDSVVHDPRLLWAARLRPRRFAVTVHDPHPHPGDTEPTLRMRATREALLTAARLVFVHGDGLRDELRDAGRAPLPPIEVVEHGTDAPALTPPPEHPTLLFFGRMSRYKGLDVLLHAMPRIWRRVPETRLVVAGAGQLPGRGRARTTPASRSATTTSPRPTSRTCSVARASSRCPTCRRARAASDRRRRRTAGRSSRPGRASCPAWCPTAPGSSSRPATPRRSPTRPSRC